MVVPIVVVVSGTPLGFYRTNYLEIARVWVLFYEEAPRFGFCATLDLRHLRPLEMSQYVRFGLACICYCKNSIIVGNTIRGRHNIELKLSEAEYISELTCKYDAIVKTHNNDTKDKNNCEGKISEMLFAEFDLSL